MIFIERNHNDDLWFLQIEAFDPHEPFIPRMNIWKIAYPDNYHGKIWIGRSQWKNEYGEAAMNMSTLWEYASLMVCVTTILEKY